ncbi:MAG: hypothetical protein H0Z28_04415 [Archaeoglobus sp.]|nr:hypothetical protein [Archaeoglobus sp.]
MSGELFGVPNKRVNQIESNLLKLMAEFQKNKEFNDAEFRKFMDSLETKEEAFIAGMSFSNAGNALMFFENQREFLRMMETYYHLLELYHLEAAGVIKINREEE